MSDVREDLKAYVDGELSASRMREVEAAIAGDPALRTEVDYLRQLSFEITQVAREVDIRGASETLARLRKPRRNVFLTPVLSAIGCLVVVAITYPLWQEPFSTAKSSVVIQSDKGANLASAPQAKSMDASPHPAETYRGVQESALEQSKSKGMETKKSVNRTGGSFTKAGVAPATTQAGGMRGAVASGPIEVAITVDSVELARQAILSFAGPSAVGAAPPAPKYANPSRTDGNSFSILVPENKVAETMLAIQALDIAREREKAGQQQATQKPKSEGGSASPPTTVGSNSAPRLVTIRVQLKALNNQKQR